MKVPRLALLAALSALGGMFNGVANAASVSCGGTVSITLITSPTAASCLTTGNGNGITGSGDPVDGLGYVTLDTTGSSGLVPLTMTLGNSGTFSFTASSAYTNYVIGFQTTEAAPKPDYFAFSLPAGDVSGSYSINDSGTLAILGVLYGKLAPSPVPGPVVGAGLPGFMMAIGGFFAWRRRKAVPA